MLAVIVQNLLYLVSFCLPKSSRIYSIFSASGGYFVARFPASRGLSGRAIFKSGNGERGLFKMGNL